MQAYGNELRTWRDKHLKNESNTSSLAQSYSGIRHANFSLVAGTELLNEQIQQIKPNIHIFGMLNESIKQIHFSFYHRRAQSSKNGSQIG